MIILVEGEIDVLYALIIKCQKKLVPLSEVYFDLDFNFDKDYKRENAFKLLTLRHYFLYSGLTFCTVTPLDSFLVDFVACGHSSAYGKS